MITYKSKLSKVILKKNSSIMKPIFIAEAGVNHENSMEKAKTMIELAQKSGAEVIKFQSYKANKIASKFSPAYWDTNFEKTKSQFELFKKYDKFWKKEYEQLKKYCDQQKIEFLSTPFDFESAKFLNDLVFNFKISSSDLTNKPLIELIANFKKPIVMSVGASHEIELRNTLFWIDKVYDKKNVAILHCVLNYPTQDKNAQLQSITYLKKNFPNNTIGYSDHTLPSNTKILDTASLLGAEIIEKHFTLDKTSPGNDHYHSFDHHDLKKFKKNLISLRNVLGKNIFGNVNNQKKARINARRSIVLKKSLKKGHIIKYSDLDFKRPGIGISPSKVDHVVGKKIKKNLIKDYILLKSDIK